MFIYSTTKASTAQPDFWAAAMVEYYLKTKLFTFNRDEYSSCFPSFSGSFSLPSPLLLLLSSVDGKRSQRHADTSSVIAATMKKGREKPPRSARTDANVGPGKAQHVQPFLGIYAESLVWALVTHFGAYLLNYKPHLRVTKVTMCWAYFHSSGPVSAFT